MILVRHGETEANRSGLALGRADVPLNETGLRQAEQLGAALAIEPVTAVYASPLVRARQTAEAIAGRLGLEVAQEPGLIEMDIGELEGLAFPTIRERFPGFLERWMSDAGPEHPMPGGERLIDVAERGWQTISRLAEQHAGETIVAVTHNFILLTIIARALGMKIAGFRRLRHSVGALTVLEIESGRVSVSRLNDTCHLNCE